MVAAINISGPAASLDTGALEGVYKDRVCETARRISIQLGHRPDSLQRVASGNAPPTI